MTDVVIKHLSYLYGIKVGAFGFAGNTFRALTAYALVPITYKVTRQDTTAYEKASGHAHLTIEERPR